MTALLGRNYFPGFKNRSTIKYLEVTSPDRPFYPERGGVLKEVTVAYETYGKLADAKDNVILVLHALTGDSHCAAHNAGDEEGWWDLLVGPDRPIDTNRFFVICANVLGGCQGTTGPASPDPETGLPYGMNFPEITVRDMVRVQKLLLDALNIRQLVMVIGGSMGGMQALEWAVTFPDLAGAAVVIAAPGAASAQAIAYNSIGCKAVRLDPDWQGGNYYGGAGPKKGLSVARALGMITYQSEQSMERKFGRRVNVDQFTVESYLDYQGEALYQRFDANTYLYLLKALDLHDVGHGYPSAEVALTRISGKVLIVGVSSDILYPAHQQKELAETMVRLGVAAEYVEIDSPNGHDGFLIDFHLLQPLLYRFVDRIAASSIPGWLAKRFLPGQLAYLGARIVSQGKLLGPEQIYAVSYP